MLAGGRRCPGIGPPGRCDALSYIVTVAGGVGPGREGRDHNERGKYELKHQDYGRVYWLAAIDFEYWFLIYIKIVIRDRGGSKEGAVDKSPGNYCGCTA